MGDTIPCDAGFKQPDSAQDLIQKMLQTGTIQRHGAGSMFMEDVECKML